MNTAVINIKTQSEVKTKAEKIASDLGISLGSLINIYLKRLVRTQRVNFSVEEPSEYLKRVMRQADKDLKAGKASPSFDNAKDAIAWLHRSR